MFNKKPRRNFRQRKKSSSDDEEHKKNSDEGDEDEGVVAVVNQPFKAAQGRGISCSSKREATPPKPASSEEDEEALELREEKEERDKEGANKKTDAVLSFADDKEVEDSTFQLKRSSDKAVLFQSRKKATQPFKTTKSKASGDGGVPSPVCPTYDHGNESSPCSVHQEDDDDVVSNSDDSDSEGVGAGCPSASSDSDSSCSAARPIIIPNAKEIDAAKRRRRATRAQKEFIHLTKDDQSSAGTTPDRYSWDDEDDIGDEDDQLDDHERRIEFAPRLKSIKERIAEKLGESDDSLSGSEGEEQELWEEMQISKGIKRRPGEQSPSCSESSSYSSISSNSRQDGGRHKKRSTKTKVPQTLPHVSVLMVKKRITGKLSSLKEVFRARQAELRRMEGDVENAKNSLEILEESSSEKQLKFYRTTTLYVHNLVECLREKVVVINALELELHTQLSDQMEALLAKRRERVKEQADRLQQLSYADPQSGGSTNGTGTQCKTDMEVNTEEDFDIPEDPQLFAEETLQMQKRIADFQLRSQDVFSDVQDDFCDVKRILSRFEEWRSSYSESYHNAYISLCLPKLLNPIVRHQLLAWNPLQDVCADFETLPWFTAVETFCHGHGHEELDHTDRQTLSNIIEKTVLPKITAFVELVWDPMSQQQSFSLSGICHRLSEDYSIFEGEQSKPVKTFIEAVAHRLRSCVDEDVFIPLYPKKFLEDSSSLQCRFRDQQFWTAVKLLGNMGKWDLLLPESVLKELMLDKLLNRYLMITLCSQTLWPDAVSAFKKIADCFPLSWFKGESACLPQLQNLRNHIVQTLHHMCKQQPPEDPNTRSAVVEELKVLSRIRCYDSIMAIAEKYHYEDVIYSQQLLNQETE